MKMVILDRDGVINVDSEDYIKSPEEWHPIPGSLEAIALLNQHGFTVTIATNQSGLARGYYSEEMLQKIHQKMHDALHHLGGKIEGIFYCPHGPNDDCLCRKPKPGLLQQIASTYGLATLENVPFVGDSMRDIEAAIAANAKPVLVHTGNGQKTYQKHMEKLKGIDSFTNLWNFAKALSHPF